MEEIKEQLDDHMEQIKMIKNFISLSLRRENVSTSCLKINKDSEKLNELMVQQHELMQEELEKLKEQYDVIMRRMRNQQSIVLEHVFNERQRKLQAEEAEEISVQQVLKGHTLQVPMPQPPPASACKALELNFAKMNLNNVTPKMSIQDYKASPLVKRTKLNPIPFGFLEFEYKISSKQFESIPKYMRGRETLEEINSFLETIIIPCFNEKYQLLHRQRNVIRNPNDMELWRMFNDQISYVPGRNFITQGDISRRINKIIDKKSLNRICMMRHIGVLQEQRVLQAVCYIWTVNAF